MVIYGLCDPIGGHLRYIGFTKQDIDIRLTQHLRPSQLKKQTHKNSWLKSLLNKKLVPVIFVIQETDAKNWPSDEQWNIEYFKSLGCNLTNDIRCPGGEMPPNMSGIKQSPEHSAKISKTNKGKMPSNYTILRGIEYKTGKKMTNYNRQKLKDANVGRPWKQESKNKISKSMTGNKNSLGVKRSAEQVAKLKLYQKKTSTEQDVEILRLISLGVSQREIARRFEITQPTVGRIVKRHSC